jgi:CheY-like chemotaxis protein
MPPSNGKILVVDDQIEMMRLLADQLADAGYSVDLAGGGREALAVIASGAFDLVLTDLRMKDVDGFDVLGTVRARAPFVPVIVMTAFGTSETASEAARRGAYHHLTKPFQLADLLLHVEGALDERRAAARSALRRDLDGIVSIDLHALQDPYARRPAVSRGLATARGACSSWDPEAGPARGAKPSPTLAWMVGGAGAAHLQEILTELLDEIEVKVMKPPATFRTTLATEARAGTSRRADRPDLVLAIARPDDLTTVADARRIAEDVPVLVILSRGAPHRPRGVGPASSEGARDPEGPLLRVQAEIVRLLEYRGQPTTPARSPTILFRLGARGRAAMAALRQRALHGGAGSIPADAETRLERAIQLDLDMDRLRGTPAPTGAFTFGLHARVELTLLRLLTSEIGLLERAIQGDITSSGRG